jgi:hypothetical protein
MRDCCVGEICASKEALSVCSGAGLSRITSFLSNVASADTGGKGVGAGTGAGAGAALGAGLGCGGGDTTTQPTMPTAVNKAKLICARRLEG